VQIETAAAPILVLGSFHQPAPLIAQVSFAQ